MRTGSRHQRLRRGVEEFVAEAAGVGAGEDGVGHAEDERVKPGIEVGAECRRQFEGGPAGEVGGTRGDLNSVVDPDGHVVVGGNTPGDLYSGEVETGEVEFADVAVIAGGLGGIVVRLDPCGTGGFEEPCASADGWSRCPRK